MVDTLKTNEPRTLAELKEAYTYVNETLSKDGYRRVTLNGKDGLVDKEGV